MVSERISEEMAAIQNAVSSHIGVSEFYGGKTVFITGGTGFMGKVLLEKLLRSCPGVSKIYLLIRPKKGQDAHERLKLLLCSPVSCISFRFPPKFSFDASFFCHCSSSTP
jgi:fatty acyl-CoA reductase